MGLAVPGSIRVMMPDGQITEMRLETYLAGVVFSEMGDAAPLEAMKAQAVASRNYAASAHRHPEMGADVCTTSHCQEWKRVDPVMAPEVFRAVSETWGIVAIHDGRLIDAFFFEHCDGHTRSATDLHMSPVAYLQGVDCACGFLARKGHGVGMCQRGASVMARRGASFEQILQHYYRGIVVVHTTADRGEEIAPEPMRPTLPAPAPKPEPTVLPRQARKTMPRQYEDIPTRPTIKPVRPVAPRPTPPSSPAPRTNAQPVSEPQEPMTSQPVIVPQLEPAPTLVSLQPSPRQPATPSSPPAKSPVAPEPEEQAAVAEPEPETAAMPVADNDLVSEALANFVDDSEPEAQAPVEPVSVIIPEAESSTEPDAEFNLEAEALSEPTSAAITDAEVSPEPISVTVSEEELSTEPVSAEIPEVNVPSEPIPASTVVQIPPEPVLAFEPTVETSPEPILVFEPVMGDTEANVGRTEPNTPVPVEPLIAEPPQEISVEPVPSVEPILVFEEIANEPRSQTVLSEYVAAESVTQEPEIKEPATPAALSAIEENSRVVAHITTPEITLGVVKLDDEREVASPSPNAELPAAKAPVRMEAAEMHTPGELDVPAYVQQLNQTASLSAVEISMASPLSAPVEPTSKPAAAVPPAGPVELPALHEPVSVKGPRIHVDHLPGSRMIAGCLSCAGVIISIEDARGNKTLVFSGSATHYGDGGFETIVSEDGRYMVTIEGEQITVDIVGDTAFIHSVG